ncbi:MAG TPA: bacterial transcriptional activator domain-containing protein, partial [Thermoanaerobaculia bacterium]|nr:bacterial transcriptional activator domain-containing protein [Thermoanaerobaculia bacterium]
MLYSLRRELGAEVVLSTPDLRLDSQLITSDVDDFRAAVRARNWKEASDLYVGPFLDGFYLLDAPEFERWAETERAALASDGLRALEEFARTSEAGGRIEEAAEHWRRLTRLDPVSARYATAYMTALWTVGDRAAALAHGKEHVDLLRREFDARPDRTVAQLLDRLRTEDTPDTGAVVPSTTARVAEPVPSEHLPPVALSDADLRDGTVAPMRLGRRRRVLAVGGTAVVMAVLALVAWRSDIVPTRRASAPVLAVGQIRDLVTPDSLALGGVLSEMLATSLGRLAELQVIANSRMLELIPAHADSSRGAVSDAARRAGATEIIEGEIRPLAGGLLVLDIRRVSIPRGLVRAGYRINGNNRIALFDSVTSLIAADLRVHPPVGSLAEVSTRSPLAYRLYEEGLREYYRQDAYTAARLFQSALREDSTFAMAAYYAWRTALFTSDTSVTTLGKVAIALAARASPRDRLLIRTHIGYGTLAPSVVAAAAESLSSLYDHDPEALIVASRFMNDLSKSTALLNQSIALDSLGGVQPGAACRLCEAVARLEERYEWADSIDAALRTLDRWSRLRPEDFSAWSVRANLLARLGRRTDAAAALRRAQSLGVRDNAQMRSLIFSLFLDDISATNAQCDTALATRDDAAFSDFRWYCTIGLRIQGRYSDAAALMLRGRIPGSTATHS